MSDFCCIISRKNMFFSNLKKGSKLWKLQLNTRMKVSRVARTRSELHSKTSLVVKQMSWKNSFAWVLLRLELFFSDISIRYVSEGQRIFLHRGAKMFTHLTFQKLRGLKLWWRNYRFKHDFSFHCWMWSSESCVLMQVLGRPHLGRFLKLEGPFERRAFGNSFKNPRIQVIFLSHYFLDIF